MEIHPKFGTFSMIDANVERGLFMGLLHSGTSSRYSTTPIYSRFTQTRPVQQIASDDQSSIYFME